MANSKNTTHIQRGTMPPGGMTHGSDSSMLCGTTRPRLALRNMRTIPLRMTYDRIPVITPYAMLMYVSVANREGNTNSYVLICKRNNDESQKSGNRISKVLPVDFLNTARATQ